MKNQNLSHCGPIAAARSLLPWFVAALVALTPSGGLRAQSAVPPLPTDTTYILPLWLNYVGASDNLFAQEVEQVRQRLGQGLTESSLVRVGFAVYVSIEMPDWSVDTSDSAAVRAALSSTIQRIDAAIARARPHNLPICMNLATAVRSFYDGAQTASELEDRRNMQWYWDNGLARGWWTHSRYARKQYALQEAYIRELGKVLANRMVTYPDILVAASGDGEVELSFDRAPAQEGAVLADYSPFAIAEFRDWLRRAGLYAPGQTFAADAYELSSRYAGDASPAADTNRDGHTLNGDFGLQPGFTSWNLRYFDWSLDDNVSADPNAIPASVYNAAGWNPLLPDGGASQFDAPRVRVPVNTNAWWDLWMTFRATMLRDHNRDFAKWITTSQDPATGATVPGERWYSYQIPGDYLFNGTPSNPNWRYESSGSAWWTADISPYGSIGITSFNNHFPGLFDALTLPNVTPQIATRNRRWGIIEWNASVPASDSMTIYTNEMNVVEQYRPSLLIPYAWGHSPEQIQNTGFETALRDLIGRIKNPAPAQPLMRIDSPATGQAVRQPFTLAGWALDLGTVRGPGRAAGVDQVQVYVYSDPGPLGAPGMLVGSATYGLSRPDVGTAYGTQFTTSGYQLTVNGLPQGVYYFFVQARSTVTGTFNNSASVHLKVDLPTLSLDRAQLTFSATVRSGSVLSSTSSQEVALTQAGTGTVAWTASVNQPWVHVSPASGTGSSRLTVSLDTNALPPGTGSATAQLSISALSASNSPTLQVALNVLSETATSPPFGTIDTPINGITGVVGSLGITGWALDDVQVTKVQIYRDPVSGIDGAGFIQSNGKVYIGDATFVPGARPDVETAYGGRPYNHRAGWGYQILTNMLPDRTRGTGSGGNGQFTLHAYATDAEGHVARLGSRTITCANDGSREPFGAIDTPAQGATISGASYVNFGWALTPLPKTIPTSGSTIWVWVDGVPVGTATYNNYRSDIATLFPGYTNSNGAVGYRYLNTTTLSNGMHTISWSVTDDAGAAAGIGSRYFTVFNAGSGSVVARQGLAETPAARRASSLQASRPWIDQLMARRGYNVRAPLRPIPADEHGVYQLTIFEMDRLEVWLPSSDSRYQGYGVVAGEARDLPAGSHLDAERGVFYWQPPVGFLGSHDLRFSAVSAAGGSDRSAIPVRVHIGPTQAGGSVRMWIDSPQAGAAVDLPFVVAGWALDLKSWDDAGIDTLHVWAYPNPGSNTPPVFLGAADVGGSRPDVGLAFGRRFSAAGYGLIVSGLPPGKYDLVVFAHSAVSGAFEDARSVRVTVR